MRKFLPAVGSIVVLTLVVGCTERPATGTGMVTLDGQLIAIEKPRQGTVLFQPEGGGAVATGAINSAGEYRLATGSSAALMPGKYRAAVRVIEVILPTETAEATSRPLTPAVYGDPATSGFTFTIVPGENQCDLALDSNAGPATVADPNEQSAPIDASDAADDAPMEAS